MAHGGHTRSFVSLASAVDHYQLRRGTAMGRRLGFRWWCLHSFATSLWLLMASACAQAVEGAGEPWQERHGKEGRGKAFLHHILAL